MAHINIKSDRIEYFDYTFQGTVSGYTSGGYNGVPTIFNIIDKFPFSADADAVDVGDLSVTRSNSAGQSSSVSGYSSGGSNNSIPATYNIIDKFPFSADANAADVGDLTQAIKFLSSQSSSVSGYTSGGTLSTPTITSNV